MGGGEQQQQVKWEIDKDMMGVPMAYWSGHIPYNDLYCQRSNKDQKAPK